MRDGFIRVACATPEATVADCDSNAAGIIYICRRASSAGASLVCFPELCITSATCCDLFLQPRLLDGAERALGLIAGETSDLDCVIAVGLPVRHGPRILNCAALLLRGDLLGLVPKRHIACNALSNQARYFAPGPKFSSARILGRDVPLGWGLVFAHGSMPDFCLGVEVGDDICAVIPPSAGLAQAGATIIAGLSSFPHMAGMAEYRRMTVTAHSSRLTCAYVQANAGPGESTTDMVYAGHGIIAERGKILSESRPHECGMIFTEADVALLSYERRRSGAFARDCGRDYETIRFDTQLCDIDITRPYKKQPFVPDGEAELALRAREVIGIQSAGLQKRLAHTRCERAMLSLSGGLDSTLALLVAARAFDSMGLDRKGIRTVSMPCFGTTPRTRANARALALAIGASFDEIDISATVLSHFSDIGQDPRNHDTAYENAQARERMQVMMDMANACGALVLGTGDLSELALGFTTYNGDHMSMYGVNASVPKTLIRHILRHEAQNAAPDLARVLCDILDTPVSPELLPPENGDITQRTEDIVGPYDLHDFFIYHMLRHGFGPAKILRLCLCAFDGQYNETDIKKWLILFTRRFFSQQFKRSCMPDGPGVGTVSLSPRGGWLMPSDAEAAAWLGEAARL